MKKSKVLAFFTTISLSMSAIAADWPDKPVHMIVPYPPGGNVDLAARIVAEHLQDEYNQPFVVENRPGAGGMIAGSQVSHADPDGYTLFVAPNGPVLFSPLLFDKNDYFWKDDFEPIGSISFVPLVLQVPGSSRFDSAESLFEEAKEKPDSLMMSSPGVGTQNHLVSELMQRILGTNWLTVQYKGNATATTDLLGGRVDFNFDQLTVAKQYADSGKLKALAVTSPERLKSLPDAPTLKELGYEDAVAETFTGLFAPAGTPESITESLSQKLEKILSDKAVITQFDDAGAEARSMDREAFASFLEDQYQRWSTIIEEENISR